MIKIITGEDTIIPINDAKEFNIPNIENIELFPEKEMNPNHFEAYAKDICKQGKTKDICIFTYSAMLIEFFEVMSPYYEVESEFYLNCQKHGLLPYNRTNLYDVYDYLGKPFGRIDLYRLKVEYGRKASDECNCCNRGC